MNQYSPETFTAYEHKWWSRSPTDVLTTITITYKELQDVHTDPAVLRSWAKYKETAPYVAANPNTPPDVLWDLAEDYPDQVAENIVVPLLILAEPTILEVWEPWVIEALARSPACPDSIRARFTMFTASQFISLLSHWAGHCQDRYTFGLNDNTIMGIASVYRKLARHLLAFDEAVKDLHHKSMPWIEMARHFCRAFTTNADKDLADGILLGVERIQSTLDRIDPRKGPPDIPKPGGQYTSH